MNVIARLEYELAYYNSAVHHFNHYTTWTPPCGLRLYSTWLVMTVELWFNFVKHEVKKKNVLKPIQIVLHLENQWNSHKIHVLLTIALTKEQGKRKRQKKNQFSRKETINVFCFCSLKLFCKKKKKKKAKTKTKKTVNFIVSHQPLTTSSSSYFILQISCIKLYTVDRSSKKDLDHLGIKLSGF